MGQKIPENIDKAARGRITRLFKDVATISEVDFDQKTKSMKEAMLEACFDPDAVEKLFQQEKLKYTAIT